jgi:glycosyltransferase involved in cell wall biosynthesis
MTAAPRKPRTLAVLTNILAPYRIPVFERLARDFDVTVLLSGDEENRDHWGRGANGTGPIKLKSSWGVTVSWRRRHQGETLDTRYLHVNPGILPDLIRLRPDAIVSDEMGFRTLMALTYGKIFRRPVWVWWGGTPHTERRIGPAKRAFRKLLVGLVDGWFSYGKTSTEYLVSLGVRGEAIAELQNCVPEGAYLAPAAPALSLNPRPVLLYVGQLIRRKGLEPLLEAAAQAQIDGTEFSLLLVGGGPEQPALERLARDLGLRHVRFHGSVSPEQLPGIYRSADVLVFPTLEDVWGLVVNEALWSGLPALVSIYAGCAAELVPKESTFDPLDRDDFVRQLKNAVAGRLPAPDLSRLERADEVGARIVRALEAV